MILQYSPVEKTQNKFHLLISNYLSLLEIALSPMKMFPDFVSFRFSYYIASCSRENVRIQISCPADNIGKGEMEDRR